MNDSAFQITCWIVGLIVLGITLIGVRRLTGWRDRALAVGLAIAGSVVLFFATLRLFLVPFEQWNIARLAVTISWLKGYRLYYPPGQGPIQNHIYGPFAALAYLPAGMARSPTSALLIAGVLAAAWFFIPAAGLIWRCSPNASRLARFAAICIFGLLVQRVESLRVASSWIHADAPALGFAACAVAVLSRGKMSLRKDALVSLFAVLAVWTKQSIVPILLILPCWIALRDGWKSFTRFIGILIVVGIIVSVICFAGWGPGAMWFNMFVEPSHHPWQHSVAHVLHSLLMQATIPAILLVVAILLRQPIGKTAAARFPFLLPLAVGIALIPAALLGWIKQGGAVNNASYVTYFLLIAACCAAAECESLRWIKQQADARFGGRALLVLSSLYLAWWDWSGDLSLQSEIHQAAHVHHNIAETDFRFELAHPGEVYFPWDPLAALMASGKLYHFDYGVKDRILADFPPSDEQLHHWIPDNAKYMALPPAPCASFVMQTQLKEFAAGKNSAIDELPGYVLVERINPR